MRCTTVISSRSARRACAPTAAYMTLVSVLGTDKLRSLWSDPCKRRALLLSVSVAMAQNLTASNAILYFSTELFKEAGVEGLEARCVAAPHANVPCNVSRPTAQCWHWRCKIGWRGHCHDSDPEIRSPYSLACG